MMVSARPIYLLLELMNAQQQSHAALLSPRRLSFLFP